MFLDQTLQTSLLKEFKLILHRAVHDLDSTLDLGLESFCTVPTADAHVSCSSSLFVYTNSFLVIPMPESSILTLELVLSETIFMKEFGWCSILFGSVINSRKKATCWMSALNVRRTVTGKTTSAAKRSSCCKTINLSETKIYGKCSEHRNLNDTRFHSDTNKRIHQHE